ncbi:MAG: NapC/NirT family cytochrome c [Acidobacteria bacterium]|nr:NapC/NirT family cytochrome c [Acidobacteriota bacterium]
MRRFFLVATRNPISLLGVALTTASAVLFLFLLGLELISGHGGNPYLGILSYVLLPGIFFVSLILIPMGIAWERRRRRQGATGDLFPILDLNNATTRRLVLTFLVLTLVNVIILSAATYKSIEVMESTAFCGTTCHTVMEPEHTAYLNSPHARVKCVECHIGPGAGWFVKSKLSGARQLVSVAFDLYDRPISVPIHHLRPARETCEQCHWPSKFVGDRLSVRTHYDQDEENTELKTVLVLRVGGIQGRKSSGIHWHVDRDIQIRYRSDASRETIYEVELTDKDGKIRVFISGDSSSEDAGETTTEPGPWRIMDCIDCHNRPAHIYRMPDSEIDRALQEGLLDRTLPYVRREGLRLMRETYPTAEAAVSGITQGLEAFYAETYPELSMTRHADITSAGHFMGELHNRNVFPTMNVTWGTYPNHLGHTDFPGCFRCHDDEHVAEDGETISQDCSTCHILLAMEEENPEILELLRP